MRPEQTPITGAEDQERLTAPIKALSEFYAAFNQRDLEKMARNWAPGGDTSMDNPLGGIKRGWEEIKAVYQSIFTGPARVRVEFYDYTLHQAHDLLYAVGRERGEFRLGEEVIGLAIRTTRIFRWLGGARWRQVHHHGSIDDPELLARYQQAVLNKSDS